MARIFISYAREDEAKVSALYAKLKEVGFTPWMDVEDITPGENWERAINTAIREAHFVVVCLSPHFIAKRGFIQREIKISADRSLEFMADDIVVIPARLEECPAPEELRQFQWVDMFKETGWPKLLKALQVGAERRGIALNTTTQPKTGHQPPTTENQSRTPENQLPTPISQLPTYDFTTVTMDSSGNIVRRQHGKARYFIEDPGGLDLEMTYVPGGSFYMGLNASEEKEVRKEIERYKDDSDWVKTEMPQHEVNVPPFFIGKFQITQAQWRAVARCPKVKIELKLAPSNFEGETLPVEKVSWNDAQEFCARLSRLTGKLYRLPTEAEWEYACRAGTLTPFAFGETITPEVANYDGDFPYSNAKKGTDRSETIQVGSLGVANAYGLFDMHGNVWEWCEDVWHENYNDAPKDGSAWLSGGNLSFRVLRGGSWLSPGRLCRLSNRNGYQPNDAYNDVGVRVVMSAKTL